MPIYEYRCPDCGHRFDDLQKFDDPPIRDCPKCAAGNVIKLVSAAAFVLKGSGWYRDHYGLKSEGGESKGEGGEARGDAKADAPKEGAKADAPKADGTKGDTSKGDSGGGSPKADAPKAEAPKASGGSTSGSTAAS